MKGGQQVILLGNPGTKRTLYFERGARKTGLNVHVLDWVEWKRRKGYERAALFGDSTEDGERLLKIDPPLWESCDLEQSEDLIRDYQRDLTDLSAMAGDCHLHFFNRPEDIQALLDKRACKERLAKAGLPVTEFLEEGTGRCGGEPIRDTARLLKTMKERQIVQVFIKPVYGAGAAGTAAFRCHPRTGQMVLYTCALVDPVSLRLVNTKRLRRFTDPDVIVSLLNRLLKLDCLVERWYAKAEHQGLSYDLRAVFQEGHLDFLLARLSKGPITNLHLNNHPLSADALGLAPAVFASISDLCQKAVDCYPELKSVGIDILLEKKSFVPRIIEMNGQGDLIYQDIYGENIIYRHQAEWMKRWQERRRGKES